MVTGWPNLTATVDTVFLFITAVSVALLVAVTGTMLYFVVRYSRQRNPQPENIEGYLLLEIIWTVMPTVLVLAIFYAGWAGFRAMRTVPPGAMTVRATGHMWAWSFSYENGRQGDVLTVPVGRPVKLLITSSDVLHSLYIPALRVKEDAVPGRETYLWFSAGRPGTYELFCSEYCGEGHADMVSRVVAVPPEDFLRWYEGRAAKAGGLQILGEKGCLGCHSIDGTPKIGPSLKGIFGKKTVVVAGGREQETVADEAYLRRAIQEPGAEVVKGYPAIMPNIPVSGEELGEIVGYLKTLK